MNEQLISLETAKLAKEKGFNLNSHAYYGCDNPSSGKSNQLILRDWEKWTNFGNKDSPQEGTMIYSAPTQVLLQKWLREVHNIFVSVSGHSKIWQFYIIAYHPELGVPVNLANFDLEFKKKYLDTFIAYESYESALEVGLYEALQLIK